MLSKKTPVQEFRSPGPYDFLVKLVDLGTLDRHFGESNVAVTRIGSSPSAVRTSGTEYADSPEKSGDRECQSRGSDDRVPERCWEQICLVSWDPGTVSPKPLAICSGRRRAAKGLAKCSSRRRDTAIVVARRVVARGRTRAAGCLRRCAGLISGSVQPIKTIS